jgi:gamma-glutamylcyclotransferase (GGCT)/AIG2-like uncharacterized protein YtfP
MEDVLAFYGTLLSGLPARPNRPNLTPYVELVRECLIPGSLYDVGPYPALVPGDGVVRGELWRTTSEDALAVIDHWEGYEAALEDQAPYVRRRTRLIEPDLDAWVYVWNRPLDGLVAIPGGDWRAHFDANPPAWAR